MFSQFEGYERSYDVMECWLLNPGRPFMEWDMWFDILKTSLVLIDSGLSGAPQDGSPQEGVNCKLVKR